jgi:hypothetical protein
MRWAVVDGAVKYRGATRFVVEAQSGGGFTTSGVPEVVQVSAGTADSMEKSIQKAVERHNGALSQQAGGKALVRASFGGRRVKLAPSADGRELSVEVSRGRGNGRLAALYEDGQLKTMIETAFDVADRKGSVQSRITQFDSTGRISQVTLYEMERALRAPSTISGLPSWNQVYRTVGQACRTVGQALLPSPLSASTTADFVSSFTVEDEIEGPCSAYYWAYFGAFFATAGADAFVITTCAACPPSGGFFCGPCLGAIALALSAHATLQGATIALNNCLAEAGQGGAPGGGGGGGGGGPSCTLVVYEITYDGGQTWYYLYSGFFCT